MSAFRPLTALPSLLLLATLVGCQPKFTRLPSGLEYADTVAGQGPAAAPGQVVELHYVMRVGNGDPLDDSRQRGMPFTFQVGSDRAIRGLDEGVRGMRAGGRRILVVPPNLAYGETGTPDQRIPPRATLRYEIEMIDVRPAPG